MKAIDSSVKNQCWKWPYELTELSFGKVGPIKYQLRVCMKKIDVPGLHGVCGVKRRSARWKEWRETFDA